MIQTYVIYLGTPILCGIFARLAAKREKILYVWLIIVLLTLVSGLRSYHTGLDTYNYLSKYELIAAGAPEYAYGLEESFKVICFLLSRISDNGAFFLCVFAFLTNALIVLRLWDFRAVSSFPWMTVCYYGSFYFMTMNGIRQFCAVAIVFYATRYLQQKRLLSFLLGIGVAALLHRSALVGLVFLVGKMWQWRSLRQQERILLLCCIAALPAAIVYIVLQVDAYRHYFSSTRLDVGIMIPIKLLLYLVSLIFVHQVYRRMRREPAKAGLSRTSPPEAIPEVCGAYLIGLLLTAMGYLFAQVDRIGWYFYLYEGIYYGVLQKDEDRLNRYVFDGCVGILIGYAFLYSILHNSQGNVPYLFFWQG